MSNANKDAIYARVSGGEQEKQETIGTQLFRIHEKFDPEGRDLHDTYLDNPCTGTVVSRPALNRLMADAWAGKFNRVLIYDPDRLARGEVGMRLMLQYQLKQAGCTVVYVYGQYEDSDEGRILALFHDMRSSMEHGTIVRRFADGAANKRARGALFRGPRPYGWCYVKAPAGKKDGWLEPVEAEVVIVKEIFAHILAGKSSADVAAMLNRRGVPNVRGRLWSPKNVRDVVHQPLHTGRPARHRYTVVEPTEARKEHRRRVKSSPREIPQAEWERIDYCEGFISEEDFQQAAACLLAAQKRATRNAKSIFPLAGILRCGHQHDHVPGKVCGRLLRGFTHRSGNRYYKCSRNRASDPLMDCCCAGKAVARDIEYRLILWIDSVLHNPDALLEAWGKRGEQRQIERKRKEDALRDATTEVESIQTKLDALLMKHLAGEVDATTYARVEAQLTEARKAASGRIDLISRERIDTTWEDRHIKSFEQYCSHTRAMFLGFGGSEIESSLSWRKERFAEWFDAVWVLPTGELRLEGELPRLVDGDSDVIVAQSQNASSRNHAPRFTVTLPAAA